MSTVQMIVTAPRSLEGRGAARPPRRRAAGRLHRRDMGVRSPEACNPTAMRDTLGMP
jgi:hypothetical protein